MDETKEEESPTTDAGEGSESETAKEAKDINTAAKRMEDANKDRKEILNREEALKAKRDLGGGSEAGQPIKPQLTEEEKASRDRIKEVGKAGGAKWADDMEKEDEQK